MSERPIQLVVNVPEEEEGDLWAVRASMAELGLDVEVAFAISDLAVAVKHGTVDIAIVDLSLPGAVEAVEAIRRRATVPLRLASMRFWKRPVPDPPAWAERHLEYGDADYFARLVADFVRS